MKISVDDEPIGEVKRMTLAPGDSILVEVDRRLSDWEADRISTGVQRIFPGHQVLVVPPSITVSVVGDESNAAPA
jgi:hypothetical protein